LGFLGLLGSGLLGLVLASGIIPIIKNSLVLVLIWLGICIRERNFKFWKLGFT
jgi:hypothetical protein